MLESLFNKVAGLCKKILRAPILKNISKRLLLKVSAQTINYLFLINLFVVNCVNRKYRSEKINVKKMKTTEIRPSTRFSIHE